MQNLTKKSISGINKGLSTAAMFFYFVFLYALLERFFRLQKGVIIDYANNLSSANGTKYWKDGKEKTIKKYYSRSLDKIDRVVVHHTATGKRSSSYRDDKEWTPEQLNHLHQNERKWDRVGYYALIYPNGDVFKVNNLKTISYHVGGGKNTSSVGVAFVGNFENGVPTEEAYKSFAVLYSEIVMDLGRKVPIEPHHRYKATTCPAGVDHDMLNAQLYERKLA